MNEHQTNPPPLSIIVAPPTTAKMPSAADRVFGITELLEQILLGLPWSDILAKGQRVNKMWKDCITGSIKLQQRCWLLATPTDDDDPDPHFISFAKNIRFTGEFRVWSKELNKDTSVFQARHDLVRGQASLLELENAYKEFWYKFYTKCSMVLSYTQPAGLDPYRSHRLDPYRRRHDRFKCLSCFLPHDRFQYKHLHPVLGLLKRRAGTCVVGYGDQIHLLIGQWHPYFLHTDRIDYILDLLSTLMAHETYKATWKYSLMIQPICRTLVVTYKLRTITTTEKRSGGDGLTLSDFVRGMKDALVKCLREVRNDRLNRRRVWSIDREEAEYEKKITEWEGILETLP